MAKRVYALDEAKVKIAELEKQNRAVCETLTASIECNKDLHKRITELEKQLKEGEALVIELVAALKNQQPTEE